MSENHCQDCNLNPQCRICEKCNAHCLCIKLTKCDICNNEVSIIILISLQQQTKNCCRNCFKRTVLGL